MTVFPPEFINLFSKNGVATDQGRFKTLAPVRWPFWRTPLSPEKTEHYPKTDFKEITWTPNTVYDYPNNLVDLFEESAKKFPDIRFLGTKNPQSGQYEWLSRKQIAERVDNLRGALAKLGLTKGDKAGIIINNCVDWFVCEQAVHGLGAAFVPMYLQELPKTWKYIVTDAAVKFLFVRDESVYEKVKDFKKEISTLQEIFVVYGEGVNSLSALEEMGQKESRTFRQNPTGRTWRTSSSHPGTTGDPKGAMISHGNASWAARSSIGTFELDETSQVISILPWAHVYGQKLRSAQLYFLRRWDCVYRIAGKIHAKCSGIEAYGH